ncbi:ubiquitin-protein ligase E3C [Aethina tumida]|uniref:ubiquitin-protein ligase E3C n=1 Tax=Aethina tumida TaxID=116153 RepID=UPI00096B176F|nr:ubiquitin-protein ligase E3C [Aethina tumida]
MSFKMNYSFEGNHRGKPEQNLSGASKKLTREALLQKTHEERRKRQEQRLKLQSTELLQSHFRSYLTRKHFKEDQRQIFDGIDLTLDNLHQQLARLLIFYDSNIDKGRLIVLTNFILSISSKILDLMQRDEAFLWVIKRYLVISLKSLNDSTINTLMLNTLYTLSNSPHILEYLIRKGYFSYFRALLDQSQAELGHKIIPHGIYNPFRYFRQMELHHQELVLSQFCNHFLSQNLTDNVKKLLIPFLKSQKDFPYENIIRYLNSGYFFENGNSLLYCILALEPDDYEPNMDSIQVLSNLTANLSELKPVRNLSDESEDEEDDDVNASDNLQDYLVLLNKQNRVRKIQYFFDVNNRNEQLLKALIQLCQNLLLVHKNSVRKYLMLLVFGLNPVFLNRLWKRLENDSTIHNQLTGSSLMSWRESHVTFSVFSDMFKYYTETLTDTENSDTSETFSKNDLYSMSKLLKNVAVDLIDIAFPMSRSSAIPATQEILHMYRACLDCLKMLYMLDMRKEFCPAGFWTQRRIHISQDLYRKNYLSKTIEPFRGIITKMDDEDHLPPLSTIEQRSLAILQELPFVIPFNVRVLLLRQLCRSSLGETDFQRMHDSEFMQDNVVVIRRTHLYEDAFEKISNKSESDLKLKVRIQFINSVGLEEAGIDGGGIFKEFINEVLKTAFDPNRGFFLMTADNTLYPNPNVHLIVENFTEHYYFIGRLVGKAIFENILVDLPLAEFFLAKLLVDRASAHYLKSLDPVLYRNLLYLRDYQGDVSDLGLDFTSVSNDLGETKVMELKPNGRDIPVTNDNRLEYIQKLAEFKLNVQLNKQCRAFRSGLNSVVSLLWLKLFNHNELQVIIGGDNQEIDLSDLQAHTVYGGEFSSDHPTIILFWKILHKFTSDQRRKLLKFVTSCSRPPLLGFKELTPQFCIQPSGSEDRMPTASTCLNLLKIPVIREEEVLKNKLSAAIELQAGFELS